MSDRLTGTPDQPIPADGRIAMVVTPDGIRLRTAFWPALDKAARALVLICQGRAETIEKYFETIDDLRQRGFAVAAFDWRGQGGSERLLDDPRKGHIGNFADYRTDFDCVVNYYAGQTCLPVVALGHSMGGMILFEALAPAHAALRGAVLCSPMFEVTLLARHPWLRWVILACYGLGLGHCYPPGRKRHSILDMAFARNPLTSDAKRFGRSQATMQADPELIITAPTIGWLFHAVRAMAKGDAIAARICASASPCPMLIVVPDQDRVTDSRATRELAQRLPACELVTLADCQHEILMEQDTIRARFWHSFDQWTDRLLPRSA